MQWKSMLWWMGAVLLLACLLSTNKSRGQNVQFSKAPSVEKRVVFIEKETACYENKTVRFT